MELDLGELFDDHRQRQTAEQLQRQTRKASWLAIENAELRHVVSDLVQLLLAKAILTGEEAEALLARSGSIDQRLAAVTEDAPEPESPDVSPDLNALADTVAKGGLPLDPDRRPTGER